MTNSVRGVIALVQRCQEHKRRNVIEHLPRERRASVGRALRTTNPIENLNGRVAHFARNIKRCKDGQMTLRWVAGALSAANQRIRKLRGHRAMKTLLAALAARATGSQRVE